MRQLDNGRVYPQLEVLNQVSGNHALEQLERSGLARYTGNLEMWVNNHSSRDLSYATHGVFRYFGKFPPPIARHLILNYSAENELVIDCMCGSGTTGVEAMMLNRNGFLSDVNPLSVLLARVKTTKLDFTEMVAALNAVCSQAEKIKPYPALVTLKGLRNPDHWFLPGTKQTLGAIRDAIESLDFSGSIRDFLLVVLASVVRKVSRATTQQGRLFLDKDTAIENAIPVFEERGKQIASAISELPDHTPPEVRELSMLDPDAAKFLPDHAALVVCHPPYFNAYKYSRVNSLELAWLGVDSADLRRKEIREGFKLGKPERVEQYLRDMETVFYQFRAVRGMRENGIIALMIGDTRIHGEYLPVTSWLLDRIIPLGFRVNKIAFRVPKGTEAAWVASQRRKADEIGITLHDFVVILDSGC